MNFSSGDIVRMKKPHPCGSYEWEILRTGSDFKIKCIGCGRLLMLSRQKFEKGVKKIMNESKHSVEFIEVTKENIDVLAELSKTIWNECFIDIITKEQIDYMVSKFQSKEAMEDQIANENYTYYFINADSENVGYTGICPKENKLFLSKLYLIRESRGKGFAKKTMDFIKQKAREQNLEAVWLTVNKNNQRAIDFYKISGFSIIDSQVKDIGKGMVMDDYIMEVRL